MIVGLLWCASVESLSVTALFSTVKRAEGYASVARYHSIYSHYALDEPSSIVQLAKHPARS